VRSIFSSEELTQITRTDTRVLCIADDKALREVSGVPTLDLEVVHAIGNYTAFWLFQVK